MCDQSAITQRPFLLRTGEDRDELQSFSSAAADNAKLSASEGAELELHATPFAPRFVTRDVALCVIT